MIMKKIVFLIALSLIISSCANRRPTEEQIAAADYGSFPKDHKKTLAEYMKMVAFDPQSSQYEKWSNLHKGYITDYRGTHYGYKGCVYINSKNRLGGYVGFKPCLYLIHNDNVVVLEGDMRSGSVGEQEVLKQCFDIYQKTRTTIDPEKQNINNNQQEQQEQRPVQKPLPVRVLE